MTLPSREISHWAVDDYNLEICQFSKFCRYGYEDEDCQNKTVYTIPDDTEFRATSIAWKLPYFELKKYITKIRLPSQIGIKIQV